ncbi:MAG: cardiolipin synthase [Sandaracinaceae bacterium]|nr:cardiolipin synthase [Sandaracinaceae bacterium]MBK7778432.1 cardiolipin synthase [Sandaracinaceae bacterium]MBK8412511.1 cardiolipin synthase [Sandaracinaceae bacterium]MBK8589330.1 cardiolipin synthase [Sandaracinaceae bacterium]MBP7684023.1 cardiolipin synthase [Deltaproteobacteria bacterium]
MFSLDLPPGIVAVLTALQVMWIIASSVYILLERRSPQATIAWIATFAVLPLLGFLIYLFLGPRRFDRRKRRRRRARKVVRGQHAGPERCELPGPAAEHASTVALLENAVGDAAVLRWADVDLLLSGKEKYAALEDALRHASSKILLEYYIWEPDRTGTRVRDILAERARAGVQVKVIVDGLGSSGAGSKFWAPVRAAGGEVRHFNGVNWSNWRPTMTNFRTHRKIAVIDGHIGFTGGMNLTEHHTEEFAGPSAWRDTHLRLSGTAVEGLAAVFYEDWQYAGGDAPALMQTPTVKSPIKADFQDVPVQIVSSGPDENVSAIHKLFFSVMTGARRRIQLTTPYFVPDEPIMQALIVAAMRGVPVDLLLPASGDQPFVAAAARSYYPELLAAGVHIFELSEPVLHSKTLLVDDIAIIGTANMDNRSFRLNFEVVAVMYDQRVAAQLADAFAADVAKSVRLDEATLNADPLRRRLLAAVARLFSPML